MSIVFCFCALLIIIIIATITIRTIIILTNYYFFSTINIQIIMWCLQQISLWAFFGMFLLVDLFFLSPCSPLCPGYTGKPSWRQMINIKQTLRDTREVKEGESCWELHNLPVLVCTLRRWQHLMFQQLSSRGPSTPVCCCHPHIPHLLRTACAVGLLNSHQVWLWTRGRGE